MKTIVVSEGQSLFDIAGQYLGNANSAYDVAVLNDLSVTDVLSPGQILQLSDIIDADIATYYSEKALVPATSITDADELNQAVLEGIDYWAIEVDFVVS